MSTEKQGRGRPAKKYTEETAEQVFEYARNGTTQKEIAHMVGMAQDTLVKLYSDELERGRSFANNAVGKTLYELAVSGNVSAAIFWAKTRMGWAEKKNIGLTGDGNSVITFRWGVAEEE